ncbi:MAG: beta-hydroxyacyl-ACP dehydratase [Clostridiales bacterium]|jgi:3-hydroxyacyl-[acyl-carrier-protein] dehydratase|nr:beta-hydroxyacyl-ACP dehydratase [Clostridiales bacterium]
MIGIEEIKQVLPQRDPFLFLDEIGEIGDGKITAYYTFKPDNPILAGHLPGNPIVPGILLIEAMAQAGAYWLMTRPENKDMFAYLYKVIDFRVKKMIRPGDKCRIVAVDKGTRFRIASGEAEVYLGDELAAACKLSCMIADGVLAAKQSR